MALGTDKLRKGARRFATTIGTGGIASDALTVPLSSTTGLTDGDVLDITVDRIDGSGNLTPLTEEVITGVVSGSSLITCERGVEGTQGAHAVGAIVEIRLTAAQWDDMVAAISEEHNAADGTHNVAGLSAKTTPIDDDLFMMTDSTDDDTLRKLKFEELTAAVTNIVFPVGSIFISVVSDNPGLTLGGTWVAFGEGRTLVGLDSGDTDFDVSEEEGGAKTFNNSHNHTGPSHTHSYAHWHKGYGGPNPKAGNNGKDGTDYEIITDYQNTSTTGAGGTGNTSTKQSTTQSIVQPYITTYMFKRTV